MDWLAVIMNIVNRVPIERVLFRPPDHNKALEDFARSLPHTESPKEAPPEQKPPVTTKTPEKEGQAVATSVLEPPGLSTERKTAQLPTNDETRQELRRRLAKELYRAELDLAGGLRIAGKPCDCLDSKHSLGLEAAAEELISSEPDNPIYSEILVWLERNRPRLTIEAISSGQHDQEYPRMASEFRDFRKRIMGTTTLTAMIAPKRQISLEEAKKLAAEEAVKEVEKRWQSPEKK